MAAVWGNSNKKAFEAYKTYRGSDLKPKAMMPRMCGEADPRFLAQIVAFWIPRYSRRMAGIHRFPWTPGGTSLADVVAKDLLVSRIRVRNAVHSKFPAEVTPHQIENADRLLSRLLDVSTLSEIPSYGPSVLSLLADAKERGLSGENAAEYVWHWGNAVPDAWKRDDERRAKKLPAIDSKVKRRLDQVTIWRQTGDMNTPWEAGVAVGHQWQVRLNDFPDEYMYSLLIDGSLIGDFQEWPQAWDRGEAQGTGIDSTVKARLDQVTVWRRTGDIVIPWDADVAGHQWQVRLNDASDEHLYALLIDGALAGEFEKWPPAWDRGKAKQPKVALAARAVPDVDEASLLSRYQNGEHEAVWRDLIALGADVRQARYKEAAAAVAHETMRRAGRNVKLLVERLQQLNYRFADDKYAYRPCSKEERKLLVAWERRRLLIPLSLRAFLEEVGWVDLLGSHPALSPMGEQEKPLFLTDPLEMTGLSNLEEILEEWSSSHPADREPVLWEIGCDAEAKADVLKGEQAEGFYAVQLPNAAADAVLEGHANNLTFVEYLRLSFHWGGFPGWEKYEKRPERELAFLRDGLLPL